MMVLMRLTTGEHHDKLSEMIGQLSESMTGVKHEQEYMEVRERIHRASEYFVHVIRWFDMRTQ